MNKKISEIKAEFEAADKVMLNELYAKYEKDQRTGVVNLIQKYKNRNKNFARSENELRICVFTKENTQIFHIYAALMKWGEDRLRDRWLPVR